VLQGRSFEPDRTLPYAPLLDLLRSFLADASEAGERARLLAPVAADLAALAPELGANAPAAAVATLTPEKHRLYRALADLFFAMAARRVLVLVLEDLHWSDEATLAFLEYLAPRLAGRAVLLVLTYRTDEVSPALARLLAALERERVAAEVILPPLDAADVTAMIRAIVGPGEAALRLSEPVTALADGNPFFVEELLRSSLAEARQGAVAVPRTVQLALQRRLAALAPGARRLIEPAAVAGRRFDVALLRALTGDEEEALVAALKELINAQLVVEESADTFAFRHALTREAVYGGLLARERRALHRAVGETIERMHGGAPEAWLDDLSYHFYEAEVWEKVLRYAQRAGERAQRLYAPRAAVEHFARALRAAHERQLTPGAALLRARGEAFELIGDLEAARESYTRSLEAARTAGDAAAEAQALLALGSFWTAHDLERAGELLDAALRLSRATGDADTLGQTLNRLGNWHMLRGQPLTGRRAHEEALATFESANDRRGVAATLDLLGMTNYIGGDLLQSRHYYERAIRLMRELDDRQGLVSCLAAYATLGANYLCGTVARPVTKTEEATRDAEEALRIAREMGWRSGEANALIFLGLGLGPRGEYGRALAAVRTALDVATEIEHVVWQETALMVLGAIELDLLAYGAATEHLRRALDLSHEIGSPTMIYGVSGLLALALVRGGEPERADSLIAAALVADNPALSVTQRLVWYACAEASLLRGDAAEAMATVDRLIESAVIAGQEPDGVVPLLWHLRGRALLAMGRPEEAIAPLLAAGAAARRQMTPPEQWRIAASLGATYERAGRSEPAAGAYTTAARTIEQLACGVPDNELADTFRRGALAALPRAAQQSALRSARSTPGGLTAREREVAVLVARGHSNRAIADILVLSERTVEKHVENIMTKLDASSRAQVAAWTVAQGLDRDA
jgi:DNA-binding CsgD family transcriptional regulator